MIEHKHTGAQLDMKYNHACYATLHNQEIQECERAVYDDKMTQNKPQTSQ